MASPQTQQFEILVACTCNCFSSVGMLLFNKLAIQALPLECSLVWLQLFFAGFFMLIFGFPYLHIGSMRDFLRWCAVVPAFCGMLLTSILALKKAPMSLVIVLRSASPLFSLLIERFYPEPLRISGQMIGAVLVMMAGAAMYVSQLHSEHWEGIGWVMLNSVVAVCDRLLQRLLLSKAFSGLLERGFAWDPLYLEFYGFYLLVIRMGLIPVGLAAYLTGEMSQLPGAYAHLTSLDKVYIGLSCVIGLSIGFTGIWAQSLISATSFLVMVNANKFVIIGIEALGMHTKVLTHGQILGACLSILGGILYGKARQQIEQEEEERRQLLPSVKAV
ncbi:GFT1 [Symbiodinium natans]|uniref:GFT1 protein n=1 Tax=Symbiodinium natans TaxID=878477 RepID=A0A812MZ70_9DINO|nr:GFT1 [Symbiodinium natans]